MYCRQEMKNFIKHRHDAAEVPRACELYVWVCICGSRKKRYTMWERDSMEHKANNFAQCENVVYQTPNKLLAAHLLLLSLQYYWITLSWTFLNGICRWIPHFFGVLSPIAASFFVVIRRSEHTVTISWILIFFTPVMAMTTKTSLK